MRRTKVLTDEDLLENLRQAAAREALEEKAASLAPIPKSVAHGDSRGRGPRASDIGDLVIEPDKWRSS